MIDVSSTMLNLLGRQSLAPERARNLQQCVQILDTAAERWHRLAKDHPTAAFHLYYERAHGWLALARVVSPAAREGCLRLAAMCRDLGRSRRKDEIGQ